MLPLRALTGIKLGEFIVPLLYCPIAVSADLVVGSFLGIVQDASSHFKTWEGLGPWYLKDCHVNVLIP